MKTTSSHVCAFSVFCVRIVKEVFFNLLLNAFFVTRAADVGVEILIGGQGSGTDRS